jgi:hypothetical protein
MLKERLKTIDDAMAYELQQSLVVNKFIEITWYKNLNNNFIFIYASELENQSRNKFVISNNPNVARKNKKMCKIFVSHYPNKNMDLNYWL